MFEFEFNRVVASKYYYRLRKQNPSSEEKPLLLFLFSETTVIMTTEMFKLIIFNSNSDQSEELLNETKRDLGSLCVSLQGPSLLIDSHTLPAGRLN